MKFKEDLEQLQCPCGHPACEDEIMFHSQCHFGEPTFVGYFDGVLTIYCAVCDKPIVKIAVASREAEILNAG